jgi:hypothetical protein
MGKISPNLVTLVLEPMLGVLKNFARKIGQKMT